MSGKLYGNDFKLDKAYAEGRARGPGANPFPPESPAGKAYAAGQAVDHPIPPPPAAVPEPPNSGWLKADIQDYLSAQGIEYPADATKAELLALV
jgi:hypothetical protein